MMEGMMMGIYVYSLTKDARTIDGKVVASSIFRAKEVIPYPQRLITTSNKLSEFYEHELPEYFVFGNFRDGASVLKSRGFIFTDGGKFECVGVLRKVGRTYTIVDKTPEQSANSDTNWTTN